MYKVFINNKPVMFYQLHQQPVVAEAGEYLIHCHQDNMFDELLRAASTDPDIRRIGLVTESAEIAMQRLQRLFTLIDAAGGIVLNQTGQLLMIYRKRMWDLPKGKCEDSESPEIAAMREVCEETGICQLKVTGFAEATWHSYIHQSVPVLKRTLWYRMNATGTEPFRIQKNEGIEQARWLTLSEAASLIDLMYPLIAHLVKKFFLHINSNDG
jgi:8-oxo-dGTP pyrophosphatase MutT (NUDIX family)